MEACEVGKGRPVRQKFSKGVSEGSEVPRALEVVGEENETMPNYFSWFLFSLRTLTLP